VAPTSSCITPDGRPVVGPHSSSALLLQPSRRSQAVSSRTIMGMAGDSTAAGQGGTVGGIYLAITSMVSCDNARPDRGLDLTPVHQAVSGSNINAALNLSSVGSFGISGMKNVARRRS